MVNVELLGEQTVLRRDHVVVGVTREARAQAVGGFARLAVADAVRQDDEEARRVEELPRPEEHARELRREELCARAARPVHDEDGVADDASLVARGSPNRRVVQFQFRQALAASEMKVADDEITLDGRRIVGPRRSLSRADAGLRQDGLTGGTQQQQKEKNSSDVHSHPLSEQTCFRRTGAFPFFSRRGEKPATYLRGGETKTAFGIIACTPLLPSTSCVICKSAATLESMYASSRVRRFSVTRKSIISRRGPSLCFVQVFVQESSIALRAGGRRQSRDLPPEGETESSRISPNVNFSP